ncbi:MAG TPA: hypothetical protein VLG48_05445, partial [Candidatus Methylomirabilis sp.]|nr:hypothetical protein [Candidatus Methylomirabilis sp.]
LARAFVFVGVLSLAGCASSPKGELVSLRPGPSRQPTQQVVGESIIASLGGVAVTVRWLPAPALERFYAGKPGLVNPFPKEMWKEAPPTIFLVQIRNQTSEEVQFDPTFTFLVDQGGWRGLPLTYDEMYLGMSEGERSGPAMQSFQATLFSRFVVVSPGGQREGLLVYSVVGPDAKLLRLEFTSFFIGGKSTPGLFEFQVLRQPPE